MRAATPYNLRRSGREGALLGFASRETDACDLSGVRTFNVFEIM